MAAGLELSRYIEAGDLRRAGQWLIERYARDVVAICRAMVRERHLAEDLAQDAFSSALSGLTTFRREASPRTWLLALGWRRHGSIPVDEVPGARRGNSRRTEVLRSARGDPGQARTPGPGRSRGKCG